MGLVYAIMGIALIRATLTLSPPITTEGPCANSLDPDETPSNSASHPDPSCLILGQKNFLRH